MTIRVRAWLKAGGTRAAALRALPAAVAVAVLTGGGCAPQLDRIETGVQQNRDDIARLEAENRRVVQEIQSLIALLRMDRDAGDESSAMGLTKLSQVSGRLDQLMLKLDDNAQYMRNLSARVDLLVARSGVPTLGEYTPPAPAAQAAPDLPEEGRAVLEAAELDLSRGNLDLARSGYEEFLTRFGRSGAADQALYRLGAIEMDAGEYERAFSRFGELLERFPGSSWAPGALYKSRACLLRLDRAQEAESRGELLLRMFPDSEEAALLRAEAGMD